MFNNLVRYKKIGWIFFFILVFFVTKFSYADKTTIAENKLDYESLLVTAQSSIQTDSARAQSIAEQVAQFADNTDNDELKVRVLLLQANLAKQNKQHYLVQKYLTETEATLLKVDNIDLSIQAYTLIAEVEKSLKKYESSLVYGEKLLELAERLNNNEQLYLAYRHKAQTLKLMKRHHAALQTLFIAEKYTQDLSGFYKFQAIWDIVGLYNILNDHKVRITYINKAIDVLYSDNYVNRKVDLPKAYIQLAKSQRELNQFESAINNAKKAIESASEQNNQRMVAYSSVVLSRIYRRIGRYDDALEHCKNAAIIYKEIDNVNGFASASNALGLIYKHLDQNERAIEAHQQVLELPINKILPKYLGAALRELASHYFNSDEKEKAFVLIKQAYEVYRKAKNTKGSASVQKVMGQFYQEVNNKEAAIVAYSKAIEYSRLIEDFWNEAEVLIFMSVLKSESSPHEAEELASRGVELAKKIQARWILAQGYSALISIEEINKNPEKALTYSSLLNKVNAEIQAEKLQAKKNETLLNN